MDHRPPTADRVLLMIGVGVAVLLLASLGGLLPDWAPSAISFGAVVLGLGAIRRWALADGHGLATVEDAAEAHGAEYRREWRSGAGDWRRCGAFGEMSCFSFYANKIVTTGEGGMVVTDDPSLAARLRGLRNLCFRSDRRFYHTELGFNYRITNLQAAVGVAQIERIDELVRRKRAIGAAYADRLRDVPKLTLPVEEPWARQVYWMYGVVVDERTGDDAVSFAARLADLGVATRPFFLGMHDQPALRDLGLFGDSRFPVADRLARQGLYLPSGLALTEEQINGVCDAVRRAVR